MRYRPLDQTGSVASAVSLILPDGRFDDAQRIGMIRTALEVGINTFEIQSPDVGVGKALRRALGDLDRRLVNVGLRLSWSRCSAEGRPQGSAAVAAQIRAFAVEAGLGWLDMAVIDASDSEPPPPEAIAVLQGERGQGRVRLLGVAGEGAIAREYVQSGIFDLLAMRFNVHSGWEARNRIKDACARGLAVITYDRYPTRFAPPPPSVLAKAGSLLNRLLTGREPLGGRGSPYAFLNETPGWSAEQICLAFALTEPALASVLIDPADAEELKALAAVPEQELPAGLAAQIEMARFSNLDGERPVDIRRLRA